jgi:hypothetical protein
MHRALVLLGRAVGKVDAGHIHPSRHETIDQTDAGRSDRGDQARTAS